MSLKPARKKKCKVCRGKFQPWNSMQVACSPKCAIDLARKEQENKQRKEIREAKQRIKTRTEWLKEAQASFNKYIRIRDMGKPCPSCYRSEQEINEKYGWKRGGAWDAGHYRSRGAASQLRFNLLNVWRECKSCNGGGKYSHKDHTKTQNYRTSLIERIGEDRVLQLENNSEKADFDIEYAKRVKRIFNKRARLYKKLKGI